MRIHHKDFIDIYRWDTLCDEVFDYGVNMELPKRSCIVKVPLEQVSIFFRKCEAEKPSYRYTIVSPRSDFGIFNQRENPVNADLVKRLDFVPWKQVFNAPNYVQLPLGPACDAEHCNINDKFSIKCYAHTCGTFNKIPDCVKHWFAVNVNVLGARITCIPMGIGDGKDGEKIDEYNDRLYHVEHDLYVNFAPYTQERARLLSYWCDKEDVTVEREVSKDRFYEAIRSHQYVLCPYGNGLDCYRNLEVIYLGRTPIVHNSIWSRHLSGLFANRIDNLFNIDFNKLNHIYSNMTDFSYWQKMIFDKQGEA